MTQAALRSGSAQPHGLLHAVRWVARLWRVLIRLIPGTLFLYIVFFILSQIALLLALLLPWSILAGLMLNQVPPRVAWLFEGYGPTTAVLALMALVVFCFALHLFAEAVNARRGRQAASRILELHDKTGLSDEVRNQAAPFLVRLLKLYSMLGWLLLAAAAVAFLFLELLWVLVAYAVVAGLAVVMLRPEKRWNAIVSAEIRGKAWWGTGFILLVAYVIYRAWHGGLPHYWGVFASLLLSRQILACLVALQGNMAFLLPRAARVEALFVADTPLSPAQPQDDDFAGLARRDVRDTWLPALLAAHDGENFQMREDATRWAHQGKMLHLVMDAPQPEQDRALLIKVFHKDIREIGRHECNLLRHAAPDWPAPKLLGENQVHDHLVLVYEWSKGHHWLNPQAAIKQPLLLGLRRSLLCCEVPADLADRYNRTNIRLGQHLSQMDWAFLRQLASTPQAQGICERLQENWPVVLRWVDRQPEQVTLGALSQRQLAQDREGAIIIGNWTRWRLEPFGIDWPFRSQTREQQQQMLTEAASIRPVLRGVTVDEATLVARLEGFRKLIAGKNYTAVFAMLGDLEAQLIACGNLEEDSGSAEGV